MDNEVDMKKIIEDMPDEDVEALFDNGPVGIRIKRENPVKEQKTYDTYQKYEGIN